MAAILTTGTRQAVEARWPLGDAGVHCASPCAAACSRSSPRSLTRAQSRVQPVRCAVRPAPAQASRAGGAGAIKPLPDHGGEGRGARGPALGRDGAAASSPGTTCRSRTEQPGTIARLLVDLGDAVTRGQVLAEYDAREFELAVKQAEADLVAAQQSLARARATVVASEAALRRAQGRPRVPRGRGGARPSPQVEWAKSELERTQKLFAQRS